MQSRRIASILNLARGNCSLVLVVLYGTGLLTPGGAGASPLPLLSGDHHSRYVALQQGYAHSLFELIAEYEELGQRTQAAGLRGLAVPYPLRPPEARLAPSSGRPEIPADLPVEEAERQRRLWRLREIYAQELYLLANRARRDHQISLAFDLVQEVLIQDPSHRQARRLLGYQLYEGVWVTPFEAQKRREAFTWHERFGWIRERDVPRYERGERPYRGNWISAEQEAGIRRNFENAWIIESEHFVIRTNHSLERGVELSVMLETFYRFFVSHFAAVFRTPQQLAALFEGEGAVAGTSRRHEVHYFATREEFVAALIRKQPGVENSTGLYMPGDRIAYFFHDDLRVDRNNETLFHEATHQILGESARSIDNVGARNHFWVVEGIACYMESFRGDEGILEVGSPLHERIYWARERIVTDNHYIPLEEFERLGTEAFQRGDTPTLQRRYSQATGLCHFFLHYHDGIYRDAFIEYLALLYSPNARVRSSVKSMSELTGIDKAELDRQYQDYIRSLRTVPNRP